MKHKMQQLENLISMLGERSSNKLKMKKPVVSIHVEKHEDEQPEESMLHEKMESPLEEKHEEGELSDEARPEFLRRMRK